VSRLRDRLRGDDPQRGITLAELLVSTAILAVVLPLVGIVLRGAVVADRDAQSLTRATAGAQTVVTSIEAGVRNASSVKRLPFSNGASLPASELLLARTRATTASGPAWFCQAWYYDGVARTLLTRRVSTSDPAPVIARPTSATPTGWTTLAREVAPTPPLGATGAAANNPTVFTTTASTVAVTLRVAAGERKPVALSTSITMRPQGETVSTPCF
jgi:type II secretory pathway pseudopilin PulG